MDMDEDLNIDLDEEELDELDEEELDELDDEELDEEEEVDEEEEEVALDELEADLEEVDIEEVEEVEEDAIAINDDNEEDGAMTHFNDEQTSTKVQKRNKSIQRYCKSLKDFVPRKVQTFTEPSEYLVKSIFAQFTSDNNARKFASVCPRDLDAIYQLCGKLIHKEYAFSTLYNEVASGTPHWSSATFKTQYEEETQDIAVMTTKLPVVEGLYQCSRCKSKKTLSRQMQTRSADEGMTNIIQCSECNKVWREYS